MRETVVERGESSGGRGMKRDLVTQREGLLERREMAWTVVYVVEDGLVCREQ